MMHSYITTIALEGIEIVAPVGYYEHERVNKNTFTIDIEARVETRPDTNHDDIHETLNYEKLYAVVVEEMQVSCALMEDAAYRILSKITALHKPLLSVEITLRKKNPPMDGAIQYSRVSLHWDKNNSNLL